MNRTILTVAGMLSASSFVLLDSAVKGAALLVLAALAALMLRRDSAATRHLAWLLAMVALLAAPFLSALLPQWRDRIAVSTFSITTRWWRGMGAWPGAIRTRTWRCACR